MIDRPVPPDSEELRAVRALLDGKPIGRYVLFWMQREGRRFPSGLEEVSGFAVTETQSVYWFWLDWDAERQRHFLNPFDRLLETGDLEYEEEYKAALRRLGIKPRH